MKLNFVQDTATSAVDTLTQSYSDKWEGAGAEEASAFIQFMSSNDLIYVVLGVSLIIWLVLLFFIIRLDNKVTGLEQQVEADRKKAEEETETSSAS